MSNSHLALAVFLQIGVILLVCRALGLVARRLGQPQVVGEMVAGVLLGPSLLGWVWPQASQTLFPAASMPVLFVAAQIGIVLYMFTVGLDFRTDLLRPRRRTAVSISVAGIVVPFVLGAAIARFAYAGGGLFDARAGLSGAMLFMGAAMSITAFPTLARIIHERRLTGTRAGTLALAAGSIDDAAAWCILAVMLSRMNESWSGALLAVGGGAAYAVLVLTFGRATLGRFLKLDSGGGLGAPSLALVIALLMMAAWYTDFVGIYAVFGAFLLGVAVPRNGVSARLSRIIEPLTVSLLLPLFFVYSGLNTRIGLLLGPGVLLFALLVLVAACAGKGLACWCAARLNGESRSDSALVGALMNARGLMELIILNIGLERGVITPRLFAVMVVMAVATTIAAVPLVELIRRRADRAGSRAEEPALASRTVPGASP